MRILLLLYIVGICRSTLADETLQSSANSTAAITLDVVSVNSSSVQLSWNNTSTESTCPVRRYVIRVKDNSSTRARSWRYDKSTKSAVINGLRPATDYHFRLVVDSVCSGAKGKVGKWVFVNTPPLSSERVAKSATSRRDKPSASESNTLPSRQLVPGQPLSVRTRVVTPDSVLVTWQVPADGGAINGYMIGYGEGVPDVNWQYLEAHRRNVTIKNLKPSTQYVISVRAFNDVDKGPVVYDLVYTATSSYNSVTLSEQHPAPMKLQTRMLSSTSVWIHWVDPSLGRVQRLTDSRYYNVHYQATPNGKTLSVIVKELHAVLNDLEPGTRYEFKVRTVKDGQTSPFSETVINWTFNSTAVTDPRSTSKPGRPAESDMKWRPAPSAEEESDGGNHDDDDDDVIDDEWSKVDKSWVGDGQQIQSDGSKMKREPGSVPYPRQDIKQSQQTVSSGRLQPEVKFSTLVLHRVSAYITWPTMTSSDQCGGISDHATDHVTGYRLRYQPVDDEREFVSQNLSENFVLLENLLSGVKYRYHVKYLLENGGETAWSAESVFDTTPTHH